MKAKYGYRMEVQEARTIRCSQLQELEAAYSEALGKNAAMRSTWCTTLHREHVKHMHELEERTLRRKIKVTKTFFLPVRPSCTMLHSLSRRICLPLTTFC